MKRALSAGLALFLLSATTASSEDLSLSVVVEGMETDNGQVVISLFANADDFLKRPLITEVAPIGTDGKARATFSGIAPGTYALSAYHDENANGELDTGLFGIPSEPVGASNNAKGSFGPPSFEDARFELISGETVMTITLGSPL